MELLSTQSLLQSIAIVIQFAPDLCDPDHIMGYITTCTLEFQFGNVASETTCQCSRVMSLQRILCEQGSRRLEDSAIRFGPFEGAFIIRH